MTFTFLQHIFRRATRSIWENLYLNAVSSSVIGASLVLLGLYSLMQNNLSTVIDSWNKDIHISVYFAEDVDEARRLELRDQIHSMPEVVQVRYVSESDAKKWMLEEVGGIEATLSELGDNILPASLEITLDAQMAHPDRIEGFAKRTDSDEFATADYGVEWVDKFNAFLRMFQALGTFVGLLIIIAAMFLVTNTVHLVIYNRRNELEVAKLVGATQSFIVLPFLIEGAIQGLVGALGALTCLWAIHQTLLGQLQQSETLKMVANLTFIPTSQQLVLVMIGLALGLIAALIATLRFLRKVG
jgi:cell division transport system permease protein